jgi:hypothetical protein
VLAHWFWRWACRNFFEISRDFFAAILAESFFGLPNRQPPAAPSPEWAC